VPNRQEVASVPIYEYKCAECGKCFEHIQKITEEPLASCPYCSGEVKKLVSNCSFQLKGTGWYVTDYGKKDGGNGKKKEKEKEKEKKKESSSESSTETSAKKETAAESAVQQ
jgi:putative FmdB family regulatory protein